MDDADQADFRGFHFGFIHVHPYDPLDPYPIFGCGFAALRITYHGSSADEQVPGNLFLNCKSMTNLGSTKLMGPDTSAFKESGLIHRIYLPPQADFGQSVPVVVMVHGWGGNENVMWLFKQVVPVGVAVILPRGLFGLDDGGYSWFMREQHEIRPTPDSVEVALSKFGQFIKALHHLYPIDPARMLLMGFSQGAALCNTYILAHPKIVAGVASLAGYIPPQVLEVERRPNILAGLPVFVAHGVRDEVVPLEEAQRTRDTYAELGANVTYGEYQVAHKMSTQAIKDLKDWSAQCFTDSD